MRQTLLAGLERLQISLDAATVDRLCSFGTAVIEKNKVMNLTAITAPAAVAELHLLDSLTLLKVEPLAGKGLLDVGTGAGFPGVPLKIAEPTIDLTLLDSLQKRMRWLADEALPGLGIEAACLTGRAEEFARNPSSVTADAATPSPRGEGYDVVCSRAVARLNMLCELCLPFVRVGGCFLAMKGADAAQELAEAARAIRTLGAAYERTESFEIAGALHRVIVLRKIAQTPEKYPRAFTKIKQKPL